MGIESYLKSELARDAVGKLTSLYPDQTRMNTLADFRGQWGMQTAGAWRVVGIWEDICEPPLVSVYYRPEGDRFIVSDLGEGMKGLSLRSGLLYFEAEQVHALHRAAENMNQFGGRLDLFRVEAGDLPAAICRVLLASFRVSHLTDERGMG